MNLATYIIFAGDGAGQEFVRALSAAAERSVEVRVLVDAFGEWYSRVRVRHSFRKTGVKCFKFVPPIPRRIQIQTPYFIPDRWTLAGLVTAALRGVEVDIVLPEKSNLPFIHWAMRSYLWELLRFGVRIFLVPPPVVHTKVLLADGIWALIGSANLDPRSLRMNFEFNVEVYDPVLGARLGAELAAVVARSRAVTLEEVDSRSLPIRLRDGVAKLFSPFL